MTQTLSAKEKRNLKAAAHSLKPVIMIGDKGITAGLIAETDSSLEHHELLKVKIAHNEKALRQELIDELCQQTEATLINMMGKIAIIYRQRTQD